MDVLLKAYNKNPSGNNTNIATATPENCKRKGLQS